MMIGIGMPNSQSRMPRMIVSSVRGRVGALMAAARV